VEHARDRSFGRLFFGNEAAGARTKRRRVEIYRQVVPLNALQHARLLYVAQLESPWALAQRFNHAATQAFPCHVCAGLLWFQLLLLAALACLKVQVGALDTFVTWAVTLVSK